MTLIWKLLRQHISLPQLGGFFLANLVGMTIVLLAMQVYEDILPAFRGEDGFLRNTYIIASHRVTATSAMSSQTTTFTDEEIADIEAQPFTRRVGVFTASRYKVFASIGMGGHYVGTDMFFESVPDAFVDADLAQWHYAEGDAEIPIILPRSYLAIYNFGFAESQSLPKLSEGLVSMIQMDLRLRGAAAEQTLKGRVVGFSNRLNTILVPEAFMAWSNATFAPEGEAAPTRVIIEVTTPTDDAIPAYFQEHGLESDGDQLDTGRATFLLKMVAGGVMAVGLLISLLAFYILMLSIYLLVQKNAVKLQNLLLIGYTPARVSLPYQLLTLGMNAGVLLLAVAVLLYLRGYYLDLLWQMFPQMSEGRLMPTLVLGIALFALVSIVNIAAIRHKINNINRPA